MRLSTRMSRLGTETAFELLAKAKALEAQGKDIIHLEIGEPDFDTPSHIVESACSALRNGHTHYTPSQGLAEVRARLARYASERRNIPVHADQVVITPGSKPILFYTMLALVQRGDEVLVPDPGFPIFGSMVRFAGGRPVPMRLRGERNFRPDLEEVARQVGPRTRLIILNSPHNPTGGVLTREDLEGLAEIVRRWPDLLVLSDEIYKDIIYEGEFHSIASLPGMAERTIILDGFSKSHAMTGWRLGYGIFPRWLVEPIVRLVINSVSCVPPFVQLSALAALDGPQDGVRAMVEEFRRRRDAVVEGLSRIPGIVCHRPAGAFYVFPSIRGTGMTSAEFEERALEAGVALLAGSAFGPGGEGHIRISYANSLENIRRALDRLAGMVARHTGRSAPVPARP